MGKPRLSEEKQVIVGVRMPESLRHEFLKAVRANEKEVTGATKIRLMMREYIKQHEKQAA